MDSYIVSESSLFRDPSSVLKTSNNELRIGIVLNEIYDEDNDNFSYLVESYSLGRRIVLKCQLMSKWGDIFNYEEWNPRSTPSTSIPKTGTPNSVDFSKRIGDVVVVGCLNGMSYDGIILGCVSHPARETNIIEDEVAYQSEFNGLKTSIDNDGAYRIEFQGTPINVSSLKMPLPGSLPKPQYNETIKGSYFEVDKDGSWSIGDEAQADPQSITINKPDGTIEIISGKITVLLDKASETIEITNKITNITSEEEFTLESSKISITAKEDLKIDSPKIAIGHGSVELLDSFIKLIEGLALLTIPSPNGPCSPIQSSPQWSQIESIKSKINNIKGSL